MLFAYDEGSVLPELFRGEGLEAHSAAAVRMMVGEGGEEQFSYDLPIQLYRAHPSTELLGGSASVVFSTALDSPVKIAS